MTEKENRNIVIIETPYHGENEQKTNNNINYLKKCLRDSCDKGEAPFASHLFYTQFLNDDIQEERNMGIECGLKIGELADKIVVYTDKGISKGMEYGIEYYKSIGKKIVYRSLYLNDE